MRILIIEDDAAIAANLYDSLEGAGYDPEHVADGVTGLHRAGRQDTLDDKLAGFAHGADDYLVKPFSLRHRLPHGAG